jgi:hypothetical protein
MSKETMDNLNLYFAKINLAVLSHILTEGLKGEKYCEWLFSHTLVVPFQVKRDPLQAISMQKLDYLDAET